MGGKGPVEGGRCPVDVGSILACERNQRDKQIQFCQLVVCMICQREVG